MRQWLLLQFHVGHHEKTGISNKLLSFCSIKKQSGAAMSSKFMPPKVPEIFFIVFMISFGSELSISISIESMSANRLNKTALTFHNWLRG